MCCVLSVSRAGFYRWKARSPSRRCARERLLCEEIRSIHFEHRRRYGSPRMHRELRRRGLSCGRHQVARIMREHAIVGIFRRKKPWFAPATKTPVASNILQRNFCAAAPNRAWVVDFTYIPTHQGWLFLAVVLDLFSRRIVGRHTSTLADEELVTTALQQAVAQRQPAKGLIHHSDQGSAYKAIRYGELLARYGLQPSMSRRGNCHDNAVVESFFGTLKVELMQGKIFSDPSTASAEVLGYIDTYYNHRRLHSSLGFTSPAEYEMHAAV